VNLSYLSDQWKNRINIPYGDNTLGIRWVEWYSCLAWLLLCSNQRFRPRCTKNPKLKQMLPNCRFVSQTLLEIKNKQTRKQSHELKQSSFSFFYRSTRKLGYFIFRPMYLLSLLNRKKPQIWKSFKANQITPLFHLTSVSCRYSYHLDSVKINSQTTEGGHVES
jgi:hypothetical protein